MASRRERWTSAEGEPQKWAKRYKAHVLVNQASAATLLVCFLADQWDEALWPWLVGAAFAAVLVVNLIAMAIWRPRELPSG